MTTLRMAKETVVTEKCLRGMMINFQHVIVTAGSLSNYEKTVATPSSLPCPSTFKPAVTKLRCSDNYICLIV